MENYNQVVGVDLSSNGMALSFDFFFFVNGFYTIAKHFILEWVGKYLWSNMLS